mmetsp:Transcript_8485/g.20875  ORF Transcript_8485/g.20875 Transcript_8485/m.20875 type:complete len:238 (-) Transcript_8485:994-1707(-)
MPLGSSASSLWPVFPSKPAPSRMTCIEGCACSRPRPHRGQSHHARMASTKVLCRGTSAWLSTRCRQSLAVRRVGYSTKTAIAWRWRRSNPYMCAMRLFSLTVSALTSSSAAANCAVLVAQHSSSQRPPAFSPAKIPHRPPVHAAPPTKGALVWTIQWTSSHNWRVPTDLWIKSLAISSVSGGYLSPWSVSARQAMGSRALKVRCPVCLAICTPPQWGVTSTRSATASSMASTCQPSS